MKSVICAYSLDKHSARMRTFLSGKRVKVSSFREILVEAEQPHSNQLALSIFLPLAQSHFNARVVFYGNGLSSFKSKTKFRLRQFFSPINVFSQGKLIFQDDIDQNSSDLDCIVEELHSRIIDHESLERLEYKDVVIGDLVYDTYLRKHGSPTVDLNSIELQNLLKESIKQVDFWHRYFTKTSVASICISHSVYLTAIPARVGLLYDIEIFQVNTDAIYRISSEFPQAYTDFINYKRDFQDLSTEERNSALSQSRARLQRRFLGDLVVDMPYMSKSAFTKKSGHTNPVVKDSSRINVLIAIHDFFDSPHVYGLNFYPDFLLWIKRLNEISFDVDYDWYIKTHPSIRGDGHAILEEFVSSSNGFKIVPPDTSHHQLIEEGIDCVLTVYGTIAMEYPYLGKIAINASRSNPHIAYNFSISPKDKIHYEEIIRDLNLHISNEINREEVEEYYYIHKIHHLQNWVFLDQERFLKALGGYDASNTSNIYTYFRIGDNIRTQNEYENGVLAFLNSKSPRITRAHFEGKRSPH